VKLRVANLTWQWGGDAALLDDVTGDEVDVAALVEARDIDDDPVPVARVLGSAWQVAQRLASGALAGCALAVRKSSATRLARWQSIKAAAAGHKVQQRNLIHAVLLTKTPTVVHEDHVIVIHNPLKSTGKQLDAVRAVRRRQAVVAHRATSVRARAAARARRATGRPVRTRVVRWIVLGDFNQSHAAERAALGGTGSDGHDVMGAVWGHGWGDITVTSQARPHTDHHVLTIHA